MSKSNSTGKVFLVGAGPGDPGLLTLKAAAALRCADVLLYDHLASSATVALAAPSCQKIYVGKSAGKHTLCQDEIQTLMVAKAREGHCVVRLKGGDPFVFGRGAEEAQILREAGIAFEIVPGISSAIAAPAYAGIPLTHRDHNTAFTVVTGHEDPTKPESTIDWGKLADPHQTLVLLMAMGNLPNIVMQLCRHGLPANTPVAVVRDGTRPTQQTVVASLETLVDAVERAGIGAPAIVIVGGVVGLREQIGWFESSPLFGKRVLVTRPANQSTAFAQQLWSRGAEPIIAPVIAIGPPDDPSAMQAAVVGANRYSWIVFNSSNAVSAYFNRLRQLNLDARALGNLKIAAIGPKTAQSLSCQGITADLVPSEFVSEAVAEALLAATQSHDRILIFNAQDGRDVLERALVGSGRDVTVVGAYKTNFVDDPQFADAVTKSDIVTFTSTSSVRGFVHNLRDSQLCAARGKLIACIGPITAQAARECGLQVDIIADEYTADGLLEALEQRLTLSTGSPYAR